MKTLLVVQAKHIYSAPIWIVPAAKIAEMTKTNLLTNSDSDSESRFYTDSNR